MAMKEKKATKDSDPQANRRWIAERRRRYYAGLGIPTQDDGDGEIIPTDEAWKQMYQRDLERARAYNRRYYEKNKASIKARRQAYSRQYSATPHGKAVRKEYRATARGKARMKEAQRKYRASPRGKATRKKCDAAYYQDKKKKDALYYNIVREKKAMRAVKAGDPCGHRPGLALDDAVLALQTPQAKGDELVDDPQVLAQSNVVQ